MQSATYHLLFKMVNNNPLENDVCVFNWSCARVDRVQYNSAPIMLDGFASDAKITRTCCLSLYGDLTPSFPA